MSSTVIEISPRAVAAAQDGRPVFAQMATAPSGLLMIASPNCPACVDAKPFFVVAAEDRGAAFGLLNIDEPGAESALLRVGLRVPHVPFFLATDGTGRAVAPALAGASTISVAALRDAARSAASRAPLSFSRKRPRVEEQPVTTPRFSPNGYALIDFGGGEAFPDVVRALSEAGLVRAQYV